MLSRSLVRLALLPLVALPLPALAQDTCAPTITHATQATIVWTKPPDPAPGYTLLEYQVERQRNAEPWQPLQVVPQPQVTVEDKTLSPENTYTYRVAARYRSPQGVLAVSGYGRHGVPPPCVRIVEVAPPGDVRLQAQ